MPPLPEDTRQLLDGSTSTRRCRRRSSLDREPAEWLTMMSDALMSDALLAQFTGDGSSPVHIPSSSRALLPTTAPTSACRHRLPRPAVMLAHTSKWSHAPGKQGRPIPLASDTGTLEASDA